MHHNPRPNLSAHEGFYDSRLPATVNFALGGAAGGFWYGVGWAQ